MPRSARNARQQPYEALELDNIAVAPARPHQDRERLIRRSVKNYRTNPFSAPTRSKGNYLHPPEPNPPPPQANPCSPPWSTS